MKRVFSWMDSIFCGTSSGRILSPPLHPIDASLYLEWSLSNGKALGEGLSPWEIRPAKGEVSPGLYEPFRAGKLLQHYGGDLLSVLEMFSDAHTNAYRRGSRDELLMLTRRLGADGFIVSPDGIAVTHPRHLIVLPVPEPIISVCIAHVPVVLAPAGSVPVRVFLSVVSPTVGIQLAVLARLSRLIARDRFLQVFDGPDVQVELMDLVWLHDCGLADEQIEVPEGWR
jgi:hypothetical protein